jgi:hypothetical protein
VRKVTGSGDQRAAQVGTGRLNRLLAVPVQAPGGPGTSVEQRAALGECDCARSACGQPFQRRRSGGIPQRFCTTCCRRLADAEFRRAARSTTSQPLPASSPAPAQRAVRQRSTDDWGSGIDVVTGRRVRVATRPPESVWRPGPLPWPGPRPLPSPTNPPARASAQKLPAGVEIVAAVGVRSRGDRQLGTATAAATTRASTLMSNGLPQVVERPAPQRGARHLDVRVPGQDDDAEGRTVPAQVIEHLDPGHLRQRQVEENDIGLKDRYELQRLGAPDGGAIQ